MLPKYLLFICIVRYHRTLYGFPVGNTKNITLHVHFTVYLNSIDVRLLKITVYSTTGIRGATSITCCIGETDVFKLNEVRQPYLQYISVEKSSILQTPNL